MYTQRGGSEGSYYYHTDAAGGDKTDAHYRYFLEKVTSLPVTITDAGYATLYSPVALTIPTGVTAYVAEDKGEYLSMTAIDDVIPANTGVILAGDADTYDFAITTGGSVSSNALTGTVAAIARPDDSYILSKGTNGVGFYKDGKTTIPGFKAYLPASVGGAKAFIGFNFDIADSIEDIVKQIPMSDESFDLSGRRVSKPVKGLYIINGKKVLVK